MRIPFSVLAVFTSLLFLTSPSANAGFLDDLVNKAKQAAETAKIVKDSVDDVTNDKQAEQPQPAQQPSANSESPQSHNPGLVRQIQQGLNDLGYQAGTADGIYGTGTAQAITVFEAKQGLAITGQPTQSVLAAINKAKASGASGTVAATGAASPATAPSTSADHKPLSLPQWGQAVGQGAGLSYQGAGCAIACLDAVEVLCGNPRKSAWKQEALNRARSDFAAVPAPKSGMHPTTGPPSPPSVAQIENQIKYVSDNYDKTYGATLKQGNKAVLCEAAYLDQFLDEKNQSVKMAIASGHSRYLARIATKGSQVATKPGAGNKVSGVTKVSSDTAPAPLQPYHVFLMGTRDGALKRQANIYEKLTEALIQQNQSQLSQLKKNPHRPWNCPDIPESPRVDVIPVFWDKGPSNDILARLLMTDEPDPKWVAAMMPRIEKCRALYGAGQPGKGSHVPTRISLSFYMFSPEEIEGRNATFLAKQYSARTKQSVDLAIPLLPDRYQLWSGPGKGLKYDFSRQRAIFRGDGGEEVSVHLVPAAADHSQMKDIHKKISADPQLAAALKGRHLYTIPFGEPKKPQKKYSNQPEPVTVVANNALTIGNWRGSLATHGQTLRLAAEAGQSYFVLALDQRLELDSIPMGIKAAEGLFDGDYIGNLTSEVVIRNVTAISPLLTLFTHSKTYGKVKKPMHAKALILTADLESVVLKKTYGNKVIADTGVLLEAGKGFANKKAARDAAKSSAQTAAAAAAAQKAQAEAARLASLDVMGLTLGMPFAEADKIIRKHMTPTSEYRYERTREMEPFGRSVMYVNVKERLEDAPELKYCTEQLADPRLPESYKPKVKAQCQQQKEQQFWNDTRPKEVIALMVEKSSAGADAVVGVSRWISLPEGVDKKAVIASLHKKYGSPATDRDKQSHYKASWGKVDRYTVSYCSPNSSERRAKEAQWAAGDKLPDYASVWRVPNGLHMSKTQVSSKQLDQCGPIVAAELNLAASEQSLSVLLSDHKRYKEIFSGLVASGAGPKKKTVDLDL